MGKIEIGCQSQALKRTLQSVCKRAHKSKGATKKFSVLLRGILSANKSMYKKTSRPKAARKSFDSEV